MGEYFGCQHGIFDIIVKFQCGCHDNNKHIFLVWPLFDYRLKKDILKILPLKFHQNTAFSQCIMFDGLLVTI